jgi:hypothetical protein
LSENFGAHIVAGVSAVPSAAATAFFEYAVTFSDELPRGETSRRPALVRASCKEAAPNQDWLRAGVDVHA